MSTLKQSFVEPEGFDKAKNSCVPRALALVTGLPYPEVREKVRPYRSKRGGHYTLQIMAAAERLFPESRFIFVGRYAPTLQSLTKKPGTFLVRIRKHVTVVKNGEVLDTTVVLPRQRVKQAWRVL